MEVFAIIAKYRSSGFEYLWYQSWQAGYHDILKRGFPKPADDQTVLAELRSPKVGDFLHGGSGRIPFLIGQGARLAFESAGLTGFTLGPVVVAKIATKGVRKREVRAGEPEDAILKARGVPLALAPKLHAVHVTALVEVQPDFEGARAPGGWVSAFRLGPGEPASDLWQPAYRGEGFSSWTFCSSRFRSVCETHGLSDIAFEPFDSFMERHRGTVKGP